MFKTLLCVLCGLLCSASAQATSYFAFEDYGGVWYDADKKLNGDDGYMCWAASISNALAYTGWSAGYGNADAIMDEYRDHWTDGGGHTAVALDYWFYGLAGDNSYLATPGGGGYYTDSDWSQYLARESFLTTGDQLASVDVWLRDGYGVELGFDTADGTGHSLSCYGMEYDEGGNYTGAWVVESNDQRDELFYLGMALQHSDLHRTTMWVVDDGGAYDGWTLNTSTGLAQNPDAMAPVPEPATALLLAVGGVPLWLRQRRKRS